MMDKIKNNKKLIKIISIITICILISFYIIYKLSSSLFMVITGSIILLIGSFIKDPELQDIKEEKTSRIEQLTIFSKEVLEPSIALSEVKREMEKKVLASQSEEENKNVQVIDIENTNSYKFDEIDKKIKKSRKVKAKA